MSQSLKILSLLLSILIFIGCSSTDDNNTSIFEPSQNSTSIEYFDNNTKFVITTNVKSLSESGITLVKHYLKGDNNSSKFIPQYTLELGKMSLSCKKDIQTGTYIDYNCILYASTYYDQDINHTLRLYDNTTYTVYREESQLSTEILTEVAQLKR